MKTTHEQRIRELLQQVREVCAQHDWTDEEVYGFIEERVLQAAAELGQTAAVLHQTIQRIYHSVRGLDVLQPLIDDPTITEIMVNTHQEIFIEQEGQIKLVEASFESKEKLEDIIQDIVSKVNRTVNESSPIVDARLENGSRINVILPPIALKGPTLTIRKFPERPLQMEDLIARQSITAEAANFLQSLVKARYNIFISGGTGSGKTTFLNILSNAIPVHERVITIEDAAELQLTSLPNLVRLETRNANSEGKGALGIKDLIKTSLRMRPDRIIVGEVRGEEALDMLQAMNTGHDGSLSTGHANSAQDMLSRLETMVLTAHLLPLEVIRMQIASAIDIIVHLGRLRDFSRRVIEISEVVGIQEGKMILNPLYLFQETSEASQSRMIGQLHATGHQLQHIEKLGQAGIGIQ